MFPPPIANANANANAGHNDDDDDDLKPVRVESREQFAYCASED